MAAATNPVVLLATTNPGKTREIRQLLQDIGVKLLTLADIPAIPEPDETGRTFAANAAIKAMAYGLASGLPTVAEDSGLEIDALGGRPGVESARYPGATYPDKFANLYRELNGRPLPWTARFVCSLAFVDKDARAAGPAGPSSRDGDGGSAVVFRSEGRVEGEIAPAPVGHAGFGYDPIFLYPPYGCTFGEVNNERKLAVAHRGQAFRAFRAWLAERAKD